MHCFLLGSCRIQWLALFFTLLEQVLEDLERRRKLEEQTRWEFMALDKTGNNRISLKDTLMLFKMTHGALFSMQTWNSFLKSRDSEVEDEVYIVITSLNIHT